MAVWDRIEITRDDGDEVSAMAPVIISASRSTDIPAFFSEWFMNRLKKGYATWLNPFNHRLSYVSFAKTRVVVFWTKNPASMLERLDELDAMGLNYYFQFTVNDYENEYFEPNVPPLDARIKTFQELSNRLGAERVVWRFDPLLLTDTLSVPALLEKVQRVGDRLHPYTRKLVFSFADIARYKKVQNNLARNAVNWREFSESEMLEFAKGLQLLNGDWGLALATCAEKMNLQPFGIQANRCIDDDLMIKLFKDDIQLMNFLGYEENLFGPVERPNLKDKGQRKECGCIASKDIGMYDTCNHLCVYCYANTSEHVVKNNLANHNPNQESLCRSLHDAVRDARPVVR
jgi:DNA repair photolyase